MANIKEIEEFEKSIKDRITDKEHILKVTEALLFVLDKVFNKSLQSTLSDQTNKKSIQSVSNSSLHPSIEQEDPSKVEIISEVMNLQ